MPAQGRGRSLRIYCRPICTARTPGRGRCRFFGNSALAEQGGFRPCLRCRPELAPGLAPVDAVSRTARAAASRIEAGALNDGGSLEQLAGDLGLSSRAAPPCRQARVWRLADRIGADPAPAAGEAAPHRVELADHRRRVLERLRQPAAIQRLVSVPLPPDSLAHATVVTNAARGRLRPSHPGLPAAVGMELPLAIPLGPFHGRS